MNYSRIDRLSIYFARNGRNINYRSIQIPIARVIIVREVRYCGKYIIDESLNYFIHEPTDVVFGAIIGTVETVIHRFQVEH